MVNVTDILDRTSALEKKCVPRHVHVLRRHKQQNQQRSMTAPSSVAVCTAPNHGPLCT